MGFFQRLFGAQDTSRSSHGPGDDFWYGPVGSGPAAGIYVDGITGLKLPIVHANLSILSQDVAKLPLIFYRRNDDGSKKRLPDYPIAEVMRSPNSRDTAVDFRAMLQWDLSWHRNAYCEIIPGARGHASALMPISAKWVTPKRNEYSKELEYEIRDPSKPGLKRTLKEWQVWHLRATPFNDSGDAGIPVYQTSQDILSSALACQDYSGRFWRNDAKSSGIVKAPKEHKFASDLDRNRWLAAWQAGATGANRHKDRLLQFGFDYTRINYNNNESQFLETKKDHDLAICRIWRMPPHKAGILDRATYSNIEQQSLEYVIDTLMFWLVLWEQRISYDLIMEEDVFAEFNVLSLLRGDMKSRYEAYAIARNWGWLSVNDILRKESENPIGDIGDEYMRPANMVPLGEEFPTRTGAAPSPKKKEEASKMHPNDIIEVRDNVPA